LKTNGEIAEYLRERIYKLLCMQKRLKSRVRS